MHRLYQLQSRLEQTDARISWSPADFDHINLMNMVSSLVPRDSSHSLSDEFWRKWSLCRTKEERKALILEETEKVPVVSKVEEDNS